MDKELQKGSLTPDSHPHNVNHWLKQLYEKICQLRNCSGTRWNVNSQTKDRVWVRLVFPQSSVKDKFTPNLAGKVKGPY